MKLERRCMDVITTSKTLKRRRNDVVLTSWADVRIKRKEYNSCLFWLFFCLTYIKVSYNGGLVSSDYVAAFPTWSNFPPRSFAPFWVDADFRFCRDCQIDVVRDVKDSVLQILKSELDITADPARTMVVTWRDAPSYDDRSLVSITYTFFF